ncbi:MAG TPA: transporter substrate-binding domain-containing protein [Terriglobales bacterium]|nr:transporter substrate-binding domain-containing protein [Terriglobales bacterium]
MILNRSLADFVEPFIVTLALLFTAPLSAQAQNPASPQELNVAVAIGAPFVMQRDGALTGFNIDLWNAIAARMNVKTNYVTMPDAASIFEAMRSKRVEVVAAPAIITAARDEEFDFSVPIMQAGLQIMVRDSGQTAAPNPLRDLLGLLFSKTTLLWLGIALLLVLIPAHLVWMFERGREDGIIKSRSYIPGIFEAIYWAISCLTAQAETMPHQWLARTFSIFWMFAGVVFVAFYTAQLTTTLTVQQIQGSISGPADLPGKQVATIANTVAADYLRAQNAQVSEFPQASQMFQALQSKRVDAAVFTSPVLLYYAAHEGKGLVKLVGPEFNVSPIAFCFELDSPLRRKVNLALLTLRENGSYQQIYDKWFGNP